MEIAFFTDSYVPTRDGVANVVHALGRELVALGHSVRVFAPNPRAGDPPTRTEVDGVEVTRLRSVPVPLYAEYRWALYPLARLRDEALRNVDVMHIHTPGIMGSAGFLSSRRYGKPLIGTFHTNVWEMRGSFPDQFLVRAFFRAAWWYSLGTYWRCEIATAPTEAARGALVRSARKPFRHPVEVIPNGIEVDRFRPGLSVPDWRERCGLPPGPLALYLGRLTQDKGVHRFLDAFDELPTQPACSAIIAGSGPEERAVRERIRASASLGARVRYIGPVAEEEKASLLSQSDLFVLPSTSDTSSIALLEAMASGAACLASDVGGPADIVEDGRTGRLVPVLRPGALADAIGALLEAPDERRRLGVAAVEYVRRTASIEGTARRFISLYEHLLRQGGPRAPGVAR